MSESGDHTDIANSFSNNWRSCILNLLKDGEEKIDFGSIQDAVVILGNTGAGKTTFCQFLAGDNDRLISKEIGEGIGEFIICDCDNKISVDSTIISKTTFPELLLDADTNTAFIDTPGFNDSRNEAYDAAIAYFFKKVFDKVENVKIVLIANYSSLRKGVNRIDFLHLLEHLTVLLKNIDKYVNCVALVATKVDNAFVMYEGAPVLIPDTAIIENIAKFLIEVKNSLKEMLDGGDTYISELKRVENKLFYQNALKLLDALLLKEDSKYTHLGIFRRPDQAGAVSQIEILQEGKKTIKMLLQYLPYQPTDRAEIGYTLSDKSKIIIRDVVIEINSSITANMAIINTNLITYYRDLEAKMFSDDMYLLRDRLKSASKALSRITSINESISVADFVDIMCENFTQIGAHVSKSRLRDIANLGKFLVFLQNMSPNKFHLFVWKWMKELNEAVRYVENSLKWYNFLASLYSRLSEYDIQKNKASYQIPTFETLPPEGLLVKDANDFVTFLRELTDNNVLNTMYCEEMKDVRLDDTKIKFFDRIAQITLRDELVYTNLHPDHCFQVVGEYVLLSEVITNKLYEKCQSAQIFAKHTVFVDASLKKNNDISIIAPRWEIIDKQSINLDGDDAPSHNLTKADDGQTSGCKGEDGKPGLPGGSAGHFFGVGSQFKNVQNLHISANGGSGGCGQYGGNGAHGENADKITLGSTKVSLESKQTSLSETIFEFPHITGGDAGRGGAGGIGGHKGDLITVDTSNRDSFINALRTANNGEPGNDGKPGQVGLGSDYNYKLQKSVDEELVKVYLIRGERGDNGKPADGVAEENRQIPTTKEFCCPPSRIISDYRIELVKNLGDCVRKHASLLFFDEIRSNHQLREYYDDYTLSRELCHLEKYYYNFTLDTAIMLYDSIFENILQIAESKTATCSNLKPLYVATNAKLLLLRATLPNHVALPQLHTTFEHILDASMSSIDLSDIQFISSTLDLLMENNLISAIESIDTQIIESSHPKREKVDDDVEGLGNLLLKRKVLSTLKTSAHFLNFLTKMLIVDWNITKNLEIVDVIPSIEFKSIEMDSSTKNEFQNATFEFLLDAADINNILYTLISAERRTYEKLTNAKNELVEELLGIEQKIKSKVFKNAVSFSATSTMKETKHFFEILLEQLEPENTVHNVNSNEMEMMKRIEAHIKLLEFDNQLYRQLYRDSNIERLVETLPKHSTAEEQNSFNEVTALITEILNTVQADFAVLHDRNKMSEVRTKGMQFINSVSTYISGITKQFDSDAEVRSIVENLLEVVELLRNTYDRINFEEVQVLLDSSSYWFERMNRLDTPLLEFSRKNRMLHAHQHIVEVFKRSVLPFALLNPEIPSIPDDAFTQSKDILKESLVNNINALQKNLNVLLKTRSYPNILKGCTPITENGVLMFEWKNPSIAKQITHLLRGRQIALTASINRTDDRQCLRYNSIRLRFKMLDETQQSKLNDVLGKFTIRMVHSGNSSYAFCNRVYSFDEKRCEYQCTNNTEVLSEYPKSPYAMWLFSLLPVDKNISHFRSLRTFIGQNIDLQLEGSIKYFKIEDKALIYETLEKNTMDADYSKLMNGHMVDFQSLEQDDDELLTNGSNDLKNHNLSHHHQYHT